MAMLYSIIFLSGVITTLLWLRSTRRNDPGRNAPPIIRIPDELLFQNPQKAYEDAIRLHGKVVGVYRKNRLEFIVDQSLTTEVLTNDALFSFEQGTMEILNLKPLLRLPRSFISGIDKLVHEGLIPTLDNIITAVAPVFERKVGHVTKSLNLPNASPVSVDITPFVQSLMAESMIILLLGKNYTTPEYIDAVEKIGVEIATISGIYQNLSWWQRNFTAVWRVLIWIRVVGYSIPRNFLFGIGWSAFKELNKSENECKLDKDSLMYTWSQRYRDPKTSKLNVTDRVWMLFLLLGLIFASVHQSAVVMVWVLFELAKRPEELEALRSEYLPETNEEGQLALTYRSLRNAERLDSFVREVLRTKRDTLSTIRQATRDVPIGGYVLPKGSLVIPLATLSHESEEYHGEDAKEFISDRWVGRDKPAVKVGPGYWPFGMGRWACPGRALAIAEIKLLVLAVISKSTPMLEGNTYKIIDPMNTTSVPPQGNFFLAPQ